MTQHAKPPVFPKHKSAEMLDELGRYVIAEPYPFVVDLAASRGMTLATVDGDRLTDWCGLYGSKLLGYNHPRLNTPEYVRELVLAANTKMANPDFLTVQCLDYYRLLHRLAPKCMAGHRVEVYAVNSGAEAVENMMKYLINLHHRKQEARNRQDGGHRDLSHRFIYFDQAFHGRTVFALNITRLSNDPIATKDFHGIIKDNLSVPFPTDETSADACLAQLDHLMTQHDGEIAGVILEPMQGAGGHRLAPARFYRDLAELCHRHDVAWGLDEVQTAGGQCGEVFAIDMFDVPHPPQAIAVAKKFGNGAVYMLNPMEDIGVLDSTWGGSLADMVRFVHEWQIVEDEGFLEAVHQKTDRLVSELQRLVTQFPDLISHVRGLGLYQGFTMNDKRNKGRLIDIALETESLLLLGAGVDSIRFRPPLDVTDAEIDDLLARLERALARL